MRNRSLGKIPDDQVQLVLTLFKNNPDLSAEQVIEITKIPVTPNSINNIRKSGSVEGYNRFKEKHKLAQRERAKVRKSKKKTEIDPFIEAIKETFEQGGTSDDDQINKTNMTPVQSDLKAECDKKYFDEWFGDIVKMLDDSLIVPETVNKETGEIYKPKPLQKAINDLGAACGCIKKILNGTVIPDIQKNKQNCEQLSEYVGNLRNILIKLCDVVNHNANEFNKAVKEIDEKFDVIEHKIDRLIEMWEPSANAAEL